MKNVMKLSRIVKYLNGGLDCRSKGIMTTFLQCNDGNSYRNYSKDSSKQSLSDSFTWNLRFTIWGTLVLLGSQTKIYFFYFCPTIVQKALGLSVGESISK